MPPLRPRRKDLPENRRACILNAARCVFARQGYAETIVDDIAGQAGIAKGTLYLYFKSKEDIYLAALTEDARKLEDLTRERMNAVDAWQDKLKAYVSVRLDYLETHQDFLKDLSRRNPQHDGARRANERGSVSLHTGERGSFDPNVRRRDREGGNPSDRSRACSLDAFRPDSWINGTPAARLVTTGWPV